MFISHYHEAQDGFPNLEEASEWSEGEQTSLFPAVHRSAAENKQSDGPSLLQPDDVRVLAIASNNVTMTAELTAYVHNVITFLRRHRAVAGGVSPKATQMFKVLIK